MKNLVFMLWVVLFPVSVRLSDFLAFLARGSVVQTYPHDIEIAAILIITAVWVWIGWLLYEPRHR
jgi:hypothetical protein